MRPLDSRAWVEIDLGALQRNAATVAKHARAPLLPMIKADAYGLGAVPITGALEALDPWGYGCATIEEAVELRDAGIARPLVLFSPVDLAALADVRSVGLRPSLSTVEGIERWLAVGGGPWHLAVDTGMGRAGVRWDAITPALCRAVERQPPEGAYTHFHSAERNDGSLEEQERRFVHAIARLPARPPLLHAENSAALARHERSPWSLVRPGIFLYGVGSGVGARIRPEPVTRLRARVVDMRVVPDGETVSYEATYRAIGDRRIATAALGYADGYPRSLSNRGIALVRGRRVPVVGIVTMDMTMLDVTDARCELGDVATFIGDDGSDLLDVDSVAAAADASPYELLTRLQSRLPRHYLGLS